jgi:hypothetical protein
MRAFNGYSNQATSTDLMGREECSPGIVQIQRNRQLHKGKCLETINRNRQKKKYRKDRWWSRPLTALIEAVT